MDQVTHDIECAPSIATFVSLGPGVRKSTEKRVKYSRRAFEKCDGLRQCKLRSVCHGCVDVSGSRLDLIWKGGIERLERSASDKIKRLRHWLCSSCQLLRGSRATWRHAPSQPLMRSLLSQFQTPT